MAVAITDGQWHGMGNSIGTSSSTELRGMAEATPATTNSGAKHGMAEATPCTANSGERHGMAEETPGIVNSGENTWNGGGDSRWAMAYGMGNSLGTPKVGNRVEWQRRLQAP